MRPDGGRGSAFTKSEEGVLNNAARRADWLLRERLGLFASSYSVVQCPTAVSITVVKSKAPENCPAHRLYLVSHELRSRLASKVTK